MSPWQRALTGLTCAAALVLSTGCAKVAPPYTYDVSRMKTVKMLGVRLSADDVALAVWSLSQRAAHKLPVHTHVGLQTQFFALLSKLSPGWINHWVTAKMAGY